MGQIEARAWWADVQHLRDAYERTDEARRRADIAERRAARERPHAQRAAPRRVELIDLGHADRNLAVGQADRDFAVGRADRSAVGQTDRDFARQSLAPQRRGPHAKGVAIPARRTIEIRGRTVPAPSVPRTVQLDRRRPPRRAVERVGPRPDRLALWALLMGIVLILVAVGTADASMLPS